MTETPELLRWEARISISEHAARRARERLRWDDDHERLQRRIRADVREAILMGRVSEQRPEWTLNGRQRDKAFYYVYDAEATRCWIVARAQTFIVVITVLRSRGAGNDEQPDDRRVRRGMVRR